MRIFTLLFIALPGMVLAQCPAVSSYSLDGTAQDGAGSNHGIITGSLVDTLGHAGISNTAYYFDGVNDYIHINNNFDVPNKTVSLWFKAINIPSAQSQSIFSNDYPGLTNGYVSLAVQDVTGTFTLYMASGTATQLHSQTINENQWYHAVIVKTTVDTKYYINCALVATVPTATNTSSNGNPGAMIGCDRLYGRLFDGFIDDVSIYNCGLSGTQICSIFNSTSEKHGVENVFTVYPNPVAAGTNLNFSYEGEEIYQLEIYNSLGEIIHTQSMQQTSSVYLDEKVFVKGVYYARLQSAASVIAVQRFVVE